MLSKCETCNGSGVVHEYDEYDRIITHVCCKCEGSGDGKPNRFEQFREQTATIEGLVEWCVDREMCFCCDYLLECSADKDFDGTTDCKAGIKAYWEGENAE